MFYHLTERSANRKTGPIPVSTQSKTTWPTACPLKSNGCYAELGPLRLFWDKVTSSGTSFEEFCRTVAKLPRGQLWRYGQAGDLPGEGDRIRIDGESLIKLAKANRRRPVIAYTHKPPTEENLAALRRAKGLGFQVNLSANNIGHADELAKHGLPVVTVLPSEYARGRKAQSGQRQSQNIALEPNS